MLKPSAKPNETQQRMIERRYGMFIHFGINTFNDTEWSDGTLPVDSYAPPKIDADTWIKNAFECGMKYVILVAKHHDGFCMWDTDTTEYGIKHSPNPTDVVKAVSAACQKYGIGFGLYYSLWDRHEPCYSNQKKYVDYMERHLTELLDGRYGRVEELWFDGGWDKKAAEWEIDRLYSIAKRLQPGIAVGVNWTIGEDFPEGVDGHEFWPENYREGMPMRYFPSDFRLLDPKFPPKEDPKLYSHDGQLYYLPFEATICIRNMRNWFWDPQYPCDPLVEASFIAEHYKQLTNQKNCLVVNVAPNIKGEQEADDIRRLKEVRELLYADGISL